MTDTKTTLTWVLKDEVSGPARGIGGALGGLVNPTTLAIGAVAGLTGGLIAAVRAAADEQINIEKLNTSLMANVEGFNGNTDAIEELIAQRENLGFSDDEQRASLALLLAGTHDVTEAQNLQALAMDLARLKGVDLATATNAVAKANAGSTRELKALGIEITDNMTSTEALAALQLVAAGQAETYGDTLAGKWDALNIKFQDVVETIGAALLPIITSLADFALDTLIPALQDFAAAVGPGLHEAMRVAGIGVTELMRLLSPLLDLINRVTTAAGGLAGVMGILGGVISPGGTMAGALQAQITASQKKSGGTTLKKKAAGGPVDPWEAYTVGEDGPETLVMGSQGGSIIPGGGFGGVPVELAINIDGDTIARVVDRRLYLAVQAVGGAQPSTLMPLMAEMFGTGLTGTGSHPYCLFIDGLDVIKQPGTAGSIFGTDIDSIKVHEVMGQAPRMEFMIDDPAGALSPGRGANVYFCDHHGQGSSDADR